MRIFITIQFGFITIIYYYYRMKRAFPELFFFFCSLHLTNPNPFNFLLSHWDLKLCDHTLITEKDSLRNPRKITIRMKRKEEKDDKIDSPRPTFGGIETKILTMNLCARTRKYKKKSKTISLMVVGQFLWKCARAFLLLLFLQTMAR